MEGILVDMIRLYYTLQNTKNKHPRS
jgi:hypothetical protein